MGNNYHNNNFDFLRLLAAFFVFFSHCYSLYGYEEILHKYISYETLGGIGLSFFFVISGYLVCGSLDKSDKISFFVIKRLLRLIPALFLIVLLTTFILGPIMTFVTTEEYFKNSHTYTYLLNIFIFPIQYHLPGVFIDTEFKYMVNHHLWSLPIEASMYIILVLLFMLKLIDIRFLVPLLIFLLAAYSQFPQFNMDYERVEILGMKRTYLAKYGFLFFSGVLIFKLRDIVPLKRAIFIFCCLVLVMVIGNEFGNIFAAIVIPYMVYYLAYANLGSIIRNIGKYGDFSYGFYLYSFPIHQIFVQIYGQNINFVLFMVLSFFATLLCAIISYYVIEKPALNLKGKIKKKYYE